MKKAHLFVADWFASDFEIEAGFLKPKGFTWSLPDRLKQPLALEDQIRDLLARIHSSPRIDAVLFQVAPLNAEVIKALPSSCKHLQRLGIGLDNVDLPAAAARGMTVANTPDYATEEVAIHAMAMILSLHRQLAATQRFLLAGNWKTTPPNRVRRLSTLTLGTLGLGRIGKRLADRMRPMVKEVIYTDPLAEHSEQGLRQVDMAELLQSSDILSLHCPLLPDTNKIVNARTLKMMKKESILINVARGGLIDTGALIAALEGGKLAGAGLDVYESEVLELNSPLRRLPNVVLTSHTAWYSQESVADSRLEAMQKMLAAIGV